MAYRSAWKAEYKTLSETLRDLKTDIRDAQRHREYSGRMQHDLQEWRKDATLMLIERKESKIRSQEQYLKRKSLLQPVFVY